MSNQDAATQFTLKYLHLIQDRLDVVIDASGVPVCVVGRILDESINALREELRNLLGGNESVDARNAAVDFGTSHVQTVGFGAVADFDSFVKLGFLLGERVVLWDVIGSRLLGDGDEPVTSKSVLAQTACNVLTLRPVVERGGLVILPHPTTWSSLAAELFNDLHTQGNRSASTLGLEMAFAAISEGMPLHPYTLLPKDESTIGSAIKSRDNGLYSTENDSLQRAVTSILGDARFAYLKDVSATEFYNVISAQGDINASLREHFVPNLRGLSTQQRTAEIDRLKGTLIKLFEKRNSGISKYAKDGAEATVFLAISVLTVADAVTISGLAFAGATARLWSAVRKWKDVPSPNVLVQAFREIGSRMNSETMHPLSFLEVDSSSKPKVETNIQILMEHFNSEYWVEDKHKFLMSLPIESARSILHILDDDQLEVLVNHRTFQSDYIGDYLSDIWELDRESYWRHVGKSFESDDGMLIYDLNSHVEVMKTTEMPQETWQQLLRSLIDAHHDELKCKKPDFTLECVIEIFRFQTTSASHRSATRNALSVWYGTLSAEDKSLVQWFVLHVFGQKPVWWNEAPL